MLRLSEALEEHDDVQNVYSNFDIDEKELEALALSPRDPCAFWASTAEPSAPAGASSKAMAAAHRVLAHGVIRTAVQATLWNSAWLRSPQGLRAVLHDHHARCGRGGRSVLLAERQDRAEAGPCARRRAAGHRRGADCAGRIFSARDQGQRGRLWPGRKAAGAADGALAHRTSGSRSNPKMPPTRSRSRFATRPRTIPRGRSLRAASMNALLWLAAAAAGAGVRGADSPRVSYTKMLSRVAIRPTWPSRSSKDGAVTYQGSQGRRSRDVPARTGRGARDLRSGGEAGSLQAPARIRPEGRQNWAIRPFAGKTARKPARSSSIIRSTKTPSCCRIGSSASPKPSAR